MPYSNKLYVVDCPECRERMYCTRQNVDKVDEYFCDDCAVYEYVDH
jgi:hypothetical protein